MSRPWVVPTFALIACVPFAVTLVFACGGSGPPPAVSPPTTSSGTPSASVVVTNLAAGPSVGASGASASAAPPASLPPLPSASAAAPAAILTTDPAQLSAIAAAAASATPARTGASGELAELRKGLAATAAKAAPGMKADGSLASGTLKEGEHLGWSVTLAPGKCYAVVGFSPNGEIRDLDLHLLSPPFFSMLAGEDTTDDNTPVVGSSPNPMCPVAAVTLPYRVDIAAEKGAGRAAVQLFSKPN